MATWDDSVKTWVAGETLLASDFNSQIAGPLAALSGAWNAYTPTLGVFTAGNGTATGSYIRVGSFVVFRASFAFGSSSAATTGVPTLTIPITAVSTSPIGIVQGILYDTSATAPYVSAGTFTTTSTVAIGLLGTNGLRSNCTTTTPFTWATGDLVQAVGVYEAA